MNLQVMIIDDDSFAVEAVANLVKDTPFLSLKNGFTDPRLALRHENLKDVDLILLDINMPQLDGFRVMELLRKRTAIILMTGYHEHSVRGWEYDEVVDFLVKPIRGERFLKAAYKAYDLIHSKPNSPVSELGMPQPSNYLLVKGRKAKESGDWPVALEKIVYISIEEKEMRIYLDDDTFLIPSGAVPLNVFVKQKLPANQFIQVHRSYAVAKRHILRVDDNNIFVKHTNDPIPLGETFNDAFWKFLDNQ